MVRMSVSVSRAGSVRANTFGHGGGGPGIGEMVCDIVGNVALLVASRDFDAVASDSVFVAALGETVAPLFEGVAPE